LEIFETKNEKKQVYVK